MKRFEDIIDLWPTVIAFADDLRIPAQTAYGFRRRNQIPSMHWKTIVSAALKRDIVGVTLEALTEISSQNRLAQVTPDPAQAMGAVRHP